MRFFMMTKALWNSRKIGKKSRNVLREERREYKNAKMQKCKNANIENNGK